MARSRLAPGRHPALTSFTRGTGQRHVAVLAYRGLSTTEAELPANALAEALDATVHFYSAAGGPVVGVEPGRTVLTKAFTDIEPTVFVVPGGLGWRGPAESVDVVDWLTRTAKNAAGVLTVSTGSLLLAAAGLITGEAAAGHWLGRDLLDELGADATADRVATMHNETWVTASGYSAAIKAAKPLADRILWSR